MTEEIYMGNSLEYPLSELEYARIDDVWRFIEAFHFLTYGLHEYRSKVITSVRERYTEEEFYDLELLAEKLFWNLRHGTSTILLEGRPGNAHDLVTLREGSLESLVSEMQEEPFYRSFVNKLILIDDVNDRLYYKRLEGSARIFAKNRFNLLTAKAFSRRNLYESVMSDPRRILDQTIPEYYYESDYPFPNLNYGRPFIQTEGYRRDRIRRMYFEKDTVTSEGNWFRLWRPSGFPRTHSEDRQDFRGLTPRTARISEDLS